MFAEKGKSIYSPCIVVLAGPPMVGKSTLGERIAAVTNIAHLDIDKKGQLLEAVLGEPATNWFENSMRMAVKYAHLHRLAGDELVAGRPVLLTATYSHETYEYALRTGLADTYQRFRGIEEPLLRIFELDAPDETLVQRVAERLQKGSFSSVKSLDHAWQLRQKFVHLKGEDVIRINTAMPIEQNIAEILSALEHFKVTS